MYNTLDSIIWMAEGKKNEEVVVMTASLARLLRQSISNEDELVTIGKEVEYVRSYLTIQKMRYKDKLEFEIEVEPCIAHVPIIRLVLQPIVENAIYHGLKYKDSKGLLKVHGYMKGENVVIDIIDDGVGMDEETLKHIYDKHKVNYRSNGVGVYNVQQRLVLYYGKDYGIIYHSEKGKGTTASVVIPGMQEGSHERSKKCFIMAVILIAASVVIFIGLLKPEATQTRKCSLIYIPKIRDDTNDFWTSVISGCRMAAEEYESELEIMAPDKEENVEEQNRLLRAAIEKKPDAILFSPSSMNASDELLKEAKDKGIRITYIDSYTKEDLQDLTVATDNVNAGRMMGEYARTLLDKDSKIAIVSHVKGVSTAVEREQGFREGLGDYAENIVETVYCNSLYEKSCELAQKLMENTLIWR